MDRMREKGRDEVGRRERGSEGGKEGEREGRREGGKGRRVRKEGKGEISIR
jgi:hypothetical protein